MIKFYLTEYKKPSTHKQFSLWNDLAGRLEGVASVGLFDLGSDFGIETGLGLGVGLGLGIGAGAGVEVGVGAESGVGVGLETRLGVGIDTKSGMGSGVGVEVKVGGGVESGVVGDESKNDESKKKARTAQRNMLEYLGISIERLREGPVYR